MRRPRPLFPSLFRQEQAKSPRRHRVTGGTLTNQVVSKRFVKKQQTQWTPRGAHLLLQTRTKVLNDDLEDVFRGWYPQ
ncbi:MAG TPA: hypothetical protein VIT23_17380, partial [Terrimicrobiaceae bacterium]